MGIDCKRGIWQEIDDIRFPALMVPDAGLLGQLGVDAGLARRGEVEAIDTRLLDLLMSHGFLPVLSSTSMDAHHRGMNVNADTVAFALAARLGARTLVFLSDIPGVMHEGTVIGDLDAARARELVDRAVIQGGMVPKVTASLEAVVARHEVLRTRFVMKVRDLEPVQQVLPSLSIELPVGSGPYRVGRWDRGRELILDAYAEALTRYDAGGNLVQLGFLPQEPGRFIWGKINVSFD